MEDDGFKNLEMKEKNRKEYFRGIKKSLKSKLNSGNVVKTINSIKGSCIDKVWQWTH